MTERNLVIVHRGSTYDQDFKEIGAKVVALDAGVSVYCIDHKQIHVMPDDRWERPTLTVALLAKFKAQIRRGPILANHTIYKLLQHRLFVQAGLPTPPTKPFVVGMKLDPIMFGEYVVIKPSDTKLGSYGRGIQLFRRKELETMTLDDFASGHLIHENRSGFIVQRFIDTGPLLPAHRVVTFLGTPLYIWLGREKVPQIPLGEWKHDIRDYRIASNTGNFRKVLLDIDEEVLALASRVGQAFPDIPALGIDIIRDHSNGRPYVLECNPGGNIWHFSSRLAAGVRRQIGRASLVGAKQAEAIGRQLLIDQLGAFDRAAETLVNKVRELAA